MKPETIKKWLKENGKSREWLAAQCGVSKPTVDGWMGGRNIPKPALRALEVIILGANPIKTKSTLDEFSEIYAKSEAMGMTVDEFIAFAVKKAIQASLILISLFHLTRSPRNWGVGSLKQTVATVVLWSSAQLNSVTQK